MRRQRKGDDPSVGKFYDCGKFGPFSLMSFVLLGLNSHHSIRRHTTLRVRRYLGLSTATVEAVAPKSTGNTRLWLKQTRVTLGQEVLSEYDLKIMNTTLACHKFGILKEIQAQFVFDVSPLLWYGSQGQMKAGRAEGGAG